MTICYFGIYDSLYTRNKVIMTGLKDNNVNVIECRSRKSGIAKYLELTKKHKEIKDQYDVLVVGFPGWTIVPLAWILARKKLIAFDVFTSLYDSLVHDRKTIKAGSIRAGYAKFVDKLSCVLANIILLDTDAHINFFVKQYNIKKEKFIRVWVGSTMKPLPRAWKQGNDFIITFYGSDIPLQGVDYIVKAAKLVKDKDIVFRLIGSKIKNRYHGLNDRKIVFLDNVSYKELSHELANADIVLGIFGDTNKTQRVIPNKVYDAVYTGKALITSDTPAIQELLENKKNALFCHRADPRDLSNKIIELKNDQELRQKIERNNLDLAIKLRPELIIKPLISKINEYLQRAL